jgi:hypothetical protein
MADAKYFKVKNWIDARDRKGFWRMARIKATKKSSNKKTLIIVHFDGWSDKYNCSYCLHSKSIAPLRMHSKGYTGQSSVALREWEFNEETLKSLNIQMQKLCSSRFQIPAYDLTILVRGDLFIQIDCLMTFTYSNPTRDISIVENFLNKTIEFCISWMDCALVCKYPAVDYLTNINDSILMCAFEIFEMLRSILGYNKRSKFFSTYKLFTNNQKLCKTFTENMEIFLKLTQMFDWQISWQLLFLIPFIIQDSQVPFDQVQISLYLEILEKTLDHHPESSKVPEIQENLGKWFETFSKITDVETCEQLKKKFGLRDSKIDLKIEIDDFSAGSVVEHHDLQNTLESMITPVKSNQVFLTVNDSEKWPSLEKPFLASEDEGLRQDPAISEADYSKLTGLINEKFSRCQEAISKMLFPSQDWWKHSLPLAEYLNVPADTAEELVLDRLEYLLSQRNSIEALKLIRWRKKICKIALLDGWELADQISHSSISSLKVSSNDIIQANLSAFLMKLD